MPSLRTRPRRKSITVYDVDTTVDVDIDEEILAENGYHHEDTCKKSTGPDLVQAVTDLHRQAHPNQPPNVVLCRSEPCRSLSFDTLRGAV